MSARERLLVRELTDVDREIAHLAQRRGMLAAEIMRERIEAYQGV